MKTTEDLKNAKAAKTTKGQGFSGATKPSTPPQGKDSMFQPNQGIAAAQEHVGDMARIAKDSLRSQLAAKVSGLREIEDMLDNAAEAIAQREQNIVSGVTLESMLAERRQQYLAENAVDQAVITVEFEALEDEFKGMTEAPKRAFPSTDSMLKYLTPAQKARLDQAVLGPSM
ncbi:hypothetical protein QGP82_14590 [Leptothoe sp. LEGE 181152]|nr:hypothetical protein [Leptothoe sp. LEGE 181152]